MKSFPFYRQPDSMDCGPTCLKMIIKYYGKSVSLQSLREKSQLGKEGVNMLGMSEAAESMGFTTEAVRLNYTLLKKEANLPCILHWNQYHFVVLYKIEKSILHIADPSHGLAKFTEREFLERWISDKTKNELQEGVALLLEPTQKFFSSDQTNSILSEKDLRPGKNVATKTIFNYIRPHKKLILQLLFGFGVASVLQLILPFLTQSVVDIGVNTMDIHFVYVVLFAQMALLIGRMVTDFVRSWILLYVSTRINISILIDFLIKLMKLPLPFFDSKKTGDILQRMNDHQRIESFLTGSSINVLFALINLAIFSVVLAVFNFGIFTAFTTANALYSLWVIIFLKRRKTLDYKRFDVASKEQGATIQLVQGMQEIKLNGVEKSVLWNWEQIQVKLFRLNLKTLLLNQWQQSGSTIINEGKNIFITFLSARAVMYGQMSLGTMLAVQYIIGQLNSPIEQMISFVQNWQNAKISIDRLNEIHNMEDEEPASKNLLQGLPTSFTRELKGGKMKSENLYNQFEPAGISTYDENPKDKNETLIFDIQPVIQFINVSFTYSGAGNNPVLKEINLKIPKGKITAIVGISGSGKTTLLKLLLKFYDPQKGDVKLGGVSLSNISHKLWRSHCGVVMQDSFIFSDSIAMNIAVGAERIDLSKLYHAAKLANIDDFIQSLPLGFDTKIGPEGIGISMGQRQRILIARAVYRDPEFIFFDEATNSLDANNERIINDNLASFFTGKTVVVVAHRLSTVKHADQIVVLNKGIMTELGTHHELLNLKGEYFMLVKDQLEMGE